MTKKITFLTIVAAVLMMTGCTKESTKTIKATISDYNRDKSEKVYVDDAKFSCWNAGDEIRFCYGTEAADGAVADLSDDNRTGHIVIPEGAEAPFYAVYPKSAVTGISSTGATVKFESMQIYKEDANGNQIVEAPMAASTQSGTRLDFHNIASLLKVIVPAGTKVTDIYVTTTGTNRPVLWGTGTVTFPVYSNNNSENEGGSKTGETAPTLSSLTASTNAPDGGRTVYLHVNEGSHSTSTSATSESTPPDAYYIVLPPITTGTNFKVTVNYTTTETTQDNNTITHFYKNILQQSNSSSTLPANNIGVVSFVGEDFNPTPINPDIDEHLPGIFSVSPTLKVNFAKGNLNYLVTDPGSNNGETYIWRYNNNQYEPLGYNVTVANNTPVPGGYSEYSRICLLQNGTVVIPHDNGSLSGSFYDWGNFIDRSTTDNHWFTLSPYEWYYLLNVRPIAYDRRYDNVTVNGHQGLMLYPDEFLWPDPNITKDNDYSGNDWTALENAGCVFLLGGGYYDHDNPPTQHNSAQGYYWARLDGQDPAYGNVRAGANILDNQIANYLHFTSSLVETHVANNARMQAGYALMVRLVHRAD